MDPILSYLTIFFGLFLAEIVYFKIALNFNIIDKPNERSLHRTLTIRGGGIIFCVAVLIFYLFIGFQYHFFVLGLLAISTISFLDDILTLKNKIRLGVHFISVSLLFYQLDLYFLPWYWLIVVGIFVIGTINAYNFMDGSNGITGGYSLITALSLYYINNRVIDFASNDLLIIIGLSLLVFNFFNFRKKAKCFAGDVGSVSIAFILIFFLGQLIIKTNNIAYVFLFLLYGLDVITTVFFRLVRRENIFKAHRSHFYQFLINNKKLSHISVAIIYMAIQLIINFVLVLFIESKAYQPVIFAILLGMIFITLRFTIEGKNVLIGVKKSI